jgi:YVTN family beta-propeller protein
MTGFSFVKKPFIFSLLFIAQNIFAGTIFVTNVDGNSISVIDEESQKKIWDIPVGGNPHEVEVSPDHRIVLISNFGSLDGTRPGFTMSMIDTRNWAPYSFNLAKGTRPHGIHFISDKLALITAQGIQSLLVEDVYLGKTQQTISLPGKGAHCVTADAENRFAYVGNTDSGSVVKVDLKTFSVVAELKLGKSAEGVAISPDEELLLVTNSRDNLVSVVRMKDFSLLKQIPTDKGPIRVAFFNNGKSAVVTNSVSGTAQTIDLATMSISKTFKTSLGRSKKYGKIIGDLLPVPNCIVVNHDQKTAYISNIFAGNVSLIDLEKGSIISSFEAAEGPDGVAVSEDV